MPSLSHLIAGARGRARLVHDDRDRFELLRRTTTVHGTRLLAYCVMDTHLHVVAEGPPDQVLAAHRVAMRNYVRFFNARHGAEGPLLRGPVQAIPTTPEIELARAIKYVHKNPLDTHPPMAETELAYEWSSMRAFAGLSRTDFANVTRARELMGRHTRWALPAACPLVDLDPVSVPTAPAELILAAAAQTFGVLVEDLASLSRARTLSAARAVFVAVGRLEGYQESQLAAVLGRTQQRVSQLVDVPSDTEGARVVRTLLRDPTLRARLKPPKLVPATSYAGCHA
ncbi:MAG TPA: hypothetical protein VFF73_39220 [Planctomycetota bacterium]|nr:hypothetical protein [Planctomycetota bacterium]